MKLSIAAIALLSVVSLVAAQPTDHLEKRGIKDLFRKKAPAQDVSNIDDDSLPTFEQATTTSTSEVAQVSNSADGLSYIEESIDDDSLPTLEQATTSEVTQVAPVKSKGHFFKKLFGGAKFDFAKWKPVSKKAAKSIKVDTRLVDTLRVEYADLYFETIWEVAVQASNSQFNKLSTEGKLAFARSILDKDIELAKSNQYLQDVIKENESNRRKLERTKLALASNPRNPELMAAFKAAMEASMVSSTLVVIREE